MFLAFTALLISTDRSGMIIFMCIAVSLHEMAHLAAMYISGCTPNSITLIPGSVKITRKMGDFPKKEAVISLSGPIASIAVFAVFFMLYSIFKAEWLLSFSAVNLILGVFNLLPAWGLDGGSSLYCLLVKFISITRAKMILNICTLSVAAVLGFIGWRILCASSGNFSLIILALYLLLSVLVKF